MLTYKLSIDRELEARVKALLGSDQTKWPLPNMKPVTEAQFWGQLTIFTHKADTYYGQVKIGEEWATVRLMLVDGGHLIGGGLAVARFSTYNKERVAYFQWSDCDHTFTEKNVGRCLHRYTCTKCNRAYEVDSSD